MASVTLRKSEELCPKLSHVLCSEIQRAVVSLLSRWMVTDVLRYIPEEWHLTTAVQIQYTACTIAVSATLYWL